MLTIYKASAGSGKTHQLALEYVKLLLGSKAKNTADNGCYTLNCGKHISHNRHRNILAITFTNKATEEMKSRIINELVKISHSSEHVYKSKFIPDLIDIFNCPVKDIAETADRAIHELLLDYDNFNVSTIDSFFQQVLRSLAYELDYPGDYEVVIQPEAITAQAVDLMLDEYNYNHGKTADAATKILGNQLFSLMKERCNDGKDFNIFNRNMGIHTDIVSDVVALFDEKYQIVSDDFEKWFQDNTSTLQDFQDAINRNISQIKQQNAADLSSIINMLNANYSIEDDVVKNFMTFVNRFEDPDKVIEKDYSANTISKYIEQVEAGLTNVDILKKGKKKAVPDVPQAFLSELTGKLYTMIERVIKYAELKALLNEINRYSLILRTNKFIGELRTDNNIVILADTNEMLKRVMGDDSEVSFIYEKMSVDLHHFLIDEFQDTSHMQWDNLKGLVFNGLHDRHDSLIIGDEKQAIYRFRNSDSSMLHSTVESEARKAQLQVETPISKTNWRSSEQVIRFNNSFFGRMAKQLGIDGYQSVAQKVAEQNNEVPGYVRLFNCKDDDTLPKMLVEIHRQIDAGYEPGEIAVLVNTNSEAVDVVNTLMNDARNIEVTTDEALLLKQSRSVRLIVSIMQMVANAQERKNRASHSVDDSDDNSDDDSTSSKGHKYTNANDKIGRFEYEYAKNCQQGLDNQQAINKAIETTFAENVEPVSNEVQDIADVNPSTLHTLVEAIIEKRISPAEREIEIAYIAAFQDVVMSYAATYGNDIMAFLRWWNTNSKKLSITSPNDLNAINVMTVHKSKGLQFKCVHLPYSTRNLLGNASKKECTWIRTKDLPALQTLPPDVVATMPAAIRITFDAKTCVPKSIFHDLYLQNQMARRVDGFNKNYVAFTRAERELCVYFNGDKDFGVNIAQVSNYPEYKPEVENPELVGIDPFDPMLHYDLKEFTDADGNLTIGEPTTPIRNNDEQSEEEKKKAKEEKRKQDEIFADFLTPKQLVAKYPIYTDGIGTKITTVEALFNEDNSQVDDDEDDADKQLKRKMELAAERGERLHFMLSRISKLRDIPKATRSTFFCKISEQDKADLHKFFNTPETADYVKRWFCDQKRSINEMNIYNPYAPPSEQKTQRPDRVVWNKDGSIDVIDYKFTGDRSDKHNTQVRRYVNLLKELYPNAQVNGFIWYADAKPSPHVDPA